jgi:hypothetical protein
MKEGELRELLGAPYRVQLAVLRWCTAGRTQTEKRGANGCAFRLRRVRGQALAQAVVDHVEGCCEGADRLP